MASNANVTPYAPQTYKPYPPMAKNSLTAVAPLIRGAARSPGGFRFSQNPPLASLATPLSGAQQQKKHPSLCLRDLAAHTHQRDAEAVHPEVERHQQHPGEHVRGHA